MEAMVTGEVVSDNQRGGHVDETGAHSIQDAVCEEHPLDVRDKRGGQAAHTEDDGTSQAGDTEGIVLKTSDKDHRQWGTRQGYAK